MRLQRVSCRNPRHPARCMRSEPCLFSNPPEFRKRPRPFADEGAASGFSASVMFRRFSRRSRRDDSSCGAGFAPAAVSSPELTAVASSFPLAGNGSNPANVNGYYWSAERSYYSGSVRGSYYLDVKATGSALAYYGEGLYSVRCVRSVCARTGKPSFIAAACACFF